MQVMFKLQEVGRLNIHCGIYHIPLEDEDFIIMDEMNYLKHRHCYDLDVQYIKDIDTYKNIKNKTLH